MNCTALGRAMSDLTLTPAVSLEALLARRSTRQCKLFELLKIHDSIYSMQNKREMWGEFLKQCSSRTFAGTLPENEHPQAFLGDVMRQTMCINSTTFLHQSEAGEFTTRIEAIDRKMIAMIEAMPKSAEGSHRRVLHQIRYLLQDLMHQSIFVLDPDFPANYNETYHSRGMLLLGLSDDRKLLERAKKEPTIYLHAELSTIFIKAVQYWKVVDNKKPEIIKGFDAQSIEIVIDLKNVNQKTLLERFEAATCSLMFHGFRKSLQEIAY